MTGDLRDYELELAAIQLASIRADYSQKSLLGKLRHRLANEFWNKDFKDKWRFVRSIAGRGWQRVTAKFAGSQASRSISLPQDDRLNVATLCTGGMGDLLIAFSFLAQFAQEYGGPRIHVVVSPLRLGAARFLVQGNNAVDAILGDADLAPRTTPYDVVVKIGNLLSYDFLRSEKIKRVAPHLWEKFEAARQRQQTYRTFLDRQPCLDGLFAKAAVQSNKARLDVLGWLGQVAFHQESPLIFSPAVEGEKVFERFPQLAAGPYLTVHNGWDNVDHRHTTAVTKAWPVESFGAFVRLIKERLPQYQVVQLGTKTSEPIPGIDHSLLNATSLDETAWILKRSTLHVDGDSGLVHIARALQTPSVVLFGPTDHTFFSYSQNVNIHSTVCQNCWWTTNAWMHVCPRGMKIPECMVSIRPEIVVKRAVEFLTNSQTSR